MLDVKCLHFERYVLQAVLSLVRIVWMGRRT